MTKHSQFPRVLRRIGLPFAALIAVTLSLSLLLGACRSEMGPSGRSPQTDKEKLSYGMGVDIGKSLRQQNLDLDTEYLRKGIQDAWVGQGLLLSEEEISRAMTRHYESIALETAPDPASSPDSFPTERHRQRHEASQKFLREHGAEPGVVTTPKGVQYRILQEGKGAKPTLEDTVEVFYRGTVISGSEFERRLSGQPAVFPLSQVMPGWKEALPLMREGAKWKIVVPPELAFGREGSGHMIQPYATLIFEIELVKVRRAREKDV